MLNQAAGRARVPAALLSVAVAALGVTLALFLSHRPSLSNQSPPRGGYLRLLPVGSFASLPSDTRAAAEVHWSSWEPWPGNARYNHTMPARLNLWRKSVRDRAYDPRWNKYILGRITGHFKGTTDEIFQWAAAKWGIPDNLIRTIAYMESGWRQSNHGDYTYARRKCPPGYQRLPCPVTFGIVGVNSTSWPGIFPWNRDSTAAAADVLGGWLRGCYEGWTWWLRQHGNRSRGVYHAGDIWGCVGAWFSGNWHDGPANGHGGENYELRAQYWEKVRPWLHPLFGAGSLVAGLASARIRHNDERPACLLVQLAGLRAAPAARAILDQL